MRHQVRVRRGSPKLTQPTNRLTLSSQMFVSGYEIQCLLALTECLCSSTWFHNSDGYTNTEIAAGGGGSVLLVICLF